LSAIRNSGRHKYTDRHLLYNSAGESPKLKANCGFVRSNSCPSILVKANDVNSNKKIPSMHDLHKGDPERWTSAGVSVAAFFN
jgi:hypothetical protein